MKSNIRFKNVAIIGLGYVGLPLAIRFAQNGSKIFGIDQNIDYVEKLNSGSCHIEAVTDKALRMMLDKGAVISNEFKLIKNADAIIICVPTPLSKNREPDLSHIKNVIKEIAPHINEGQIISLESTTYPGTTEDLIIPMLKVNFIPGKDIHVVYSPEREDPGNKTYTTANIPKIVGGYSKKCLEKGIELYSQAIDSVVPVSSLKIAEMTKLLENIYRSVNIGLVNEMKMVADAMEIDIFEVIKAASTKPFGFTPFYPGPGLGGHCIPIDPFYLTWKAKEYDINTKFIELSGEINRAMPSFVIDKASKALNSVQKSIKGSSIHILGAAYKKNVSDTRESPAIEILRRLLNLNAQVSYSDEYVRKIKINTSDQEKELETVEDYLTKISNSDLTILITDHDYFNIAEISSQSNLLIDTRGIVEIDNTKFFRG